MCIFPDCHGIVAVLAISGKQPSSGLLHSLRFICVCVWPLSAVCYNIASSSSHRGSTLVFPGTRSHVSPRLTSMTQPLCLCARVYHNIHNRFCRTGGKSNIPLKRNLHELKLLAQVTPHIFVYRNISYTSNNKYISLSTYVRVSSCGPCRR